MLLAISIISTIALAIMVFVFGLVTSPSNDDITPTTRRLGLGLITVLLFVIATIWVLFVY